MEGYYVVKMRCVFESHTVAETLSASETFVKKAAFRLYESRTRAVSDPPKRKSKKRKISSSWNSWPLK